MTEKAASERGSTKFPTALFLAIIAIVVAMAIFLSPLRRLIRESLMQRVTTAHYEILCPSGALSQDAMTEFAKRREPLFAALNKKLGDADSSLIIRVILDPKFKRPPQANFISEAPFYFVSGTTIRATLDKAYANLPAAADAEALLYAAWGEPGNTRLSMWIANWLVGNWRGTVIGMAAADAEQRLGHKKVEVLLQNPGDEIASPNDQNLLGAAWIGEIAEFGGADAVRKLYAAKMAHPNIAEVAQALRTTPLELDRKWQLWMYSYLAGMPSLPSESGMQMKMPMNMPIAGSH